jgi:hypothetical protein
MPQSSNARIIMAFLVAPAIAAFLFSCAYPMYDGLQSVPLRILRTFLVVAVVGAYVPTVIFGLPLFLLAKRWVKPSLFACLLSGAFVAAFPWVLLTLFPAAQEASTGGRLTVVDHHLTLFGLMEGAKLCGLIALFGLLGGAAFWFLALSSRWPRGPTSA